MFRRMLQNFPVRAAGRAASGARPLFSYLAAVLLVACAKDQPESKTVAGSVVTPESVGPMDSAVAPAVARWDVANGSALYLPGDGNLAQVVVPPVLDDSVPRPDNAELPDDAAPASIDLFAPSGKTGTVSLGAYVRANQPMIGEGCDAWATVPLANAPAIGLKSWRIALQAGVAQPMPADSLGSLSRADSAMLVVAINKAAALLPLDSGSVLRRVPFGVTKAYRLRLAGDIEAVIAVVERRLNLEASPRVERTIVVLERPPKVKVFSAVWRETQYATEDDLIAVDLLAVVDLRASGRPTVFLGLDFGDGSRVEMLERSASGIWSLRWSSAYTGC